MIITLLNETGLRASRRAICNWLRRYSIGLLPDGAANTVTAPSRTQQQPRYRHHLLLAGIKRIAVQERQGMLVRFGLPVWARVRRQNLVPSEGFVIGSLLVPCVW